MRMKLVAAAAALLASTSASAVTVVGATYLKVTNAFGTFLQVAEVQANSFGSVNVAAAVNGGTASAPDSYDAFSTADKAIDGNAGGGYYTDTIYHSLGTGASAELTVNFAAPTTLQSLTLYGRTDCCSDRDVFTVSIFNASNTLLYSGTIDARGAPGTVTFDAVAGVPEPATWGLLIAGFAMTGLAARRRAKVSVTA